MYDCLIIGGGSAGLTAAIYLKRANKKFAVIEKFMLGGMLNEIGEIENYPAFTKIAGYDLAQQLREQSDALGTEVIYETVTKLELDGEIKKAVCGDRVYESKSLILAMGSKSKKLGLKNEAELTGQGVSYCATCDGAFFKNKDVAVAGSNRHAVSDTEYLSKIAASVTVVSEKPIEGLSGFANVRVVEGTIIELFGQPLTSVKVSTREGAVTLDVKGLFVSVGFSPQNFLAVGKVATDKAGFIVTDENMETSIKNVFCAGDLRAKSLRQVVTAASDGAIAAMSAAKIK